MLCSDWCGWYNDTILCWPPTPPDSQATIACSLISDLGSPCHPGSLYISMSSYCRETVTPSSCQLMPQTHNSRNPKALKVPLVGALGAPHCVFVA